MENSSIVPIIVVLAITVFIWALRRRRPCVTCGKVHWGDENVFYCSQCGKPFCRDTSAYVENNQIQAAGASSNLNTQIVSTYQVQGGEECGVVYQNIFNGQHYEPQAFCKEHDPR